MPQSVKLSDELIKQARHPDLPYSFIKDILLAQREVLSGDVAPYDFG